MGTNDNYTLTDVKKAVSVLENHNTTRDYQALEEILPLVLVILKSKVTEEEPPAGGYEVLRPNLGRCASGTSQHSEAPTF